MNENYHMFISCHFTKGKKESGREKRVGERRERLREKRDRERGVCVSVCERERERRGMDGNVAIKMVEAFREPLLEGRAQYG
jgi:hypothetical protein